MSVEELTEWFTRAPVAILTGAGVSTDSGIPDYRGTGTPPRTPMHIHEFLGDPVYRRRFWAGAGVHAARRQRVAPNDGHRAIADLERLGVIDGVITQNVDNLHREAGSHHVVELHGNGSRVRCVSCGATTTRQETITRFNALNPGYVDGQRDGIIAPDGDARVTDYEDLQIPDCIVCGSILRPEIVYFGETVPPEVFAEAERLLNDATALVIAGSSLAVNTGLRLVHRAERKGIPVATINRGPTAADQRATLRIEGGTTETLTAVRNAIEGSQPSSPSR